MSAHAHSGGSARPVISGVRRKRAASLPLSENEISPLPQFLMMIHSVGNFRKIEKCLRIIALWMM